MSDVRFNKDLNAFQYGPVSFYNKGSIRIPHNLRTMVGVSDDDSFMISVPFESVSDGIPKFIIEKVDDKEMLLDDESDNSVSAEPLDDFDTTTKGGY